MSHIRVLSRRPGFRRAGIAHPAQKDYAPGELTADQLAALRDEPVLTVIESAVPFDQVLPSGGTLAFDKGVDDRLALVVRACGVPESHNILVASEMFEHAQQANQGQVSFTVFCGRVIEFAQRRIAHMALEIPSPEQTAESAGGEAQPEPGQGAPVSDNPDGGRADDGGSGTQAPETGETSETGAAAASEVASSDTKPTTAKSRAKAK